MSDSSMARIAQLEARLAALEQSASAPEQPPEGLRERIQRERQERVAESRASREKERGPDDRAGNPRPTSPHRAKEIERRSSASLPGPAIPPRQRGGDAARPLGSTVSVVVVDNGEFKTGNFYVEGALAAI